MRRSLKKSTKILVVDDDEDLLESTAMLLSHLGYSVKAAQNGHAALALLRAEEDVSVLLTDVVMPGMTGFELADHAKSLSPDLCVIYMTGYSPHSLPQTGDLHGNLVMKPWELDHLVKEIEDCFAR